MKHPLPIATGIGGGAILPLTVYPRTAIISTFPELLDNIRLQTICKHIGHDRIPLELHHIEAPLNGQNLDFNQHLEIAPHNSARLEIRLEITDEMQKDNQITLISNLHGVIWRNVDFVISCQVNSFKEIDADRGKLSIYAFNNCNENTFINCTFKITTHIAISRISAIWVPADDIIEPPHIPIIPDYIGGGTGGGTGGGGIGGGGGTGGGGTGGGSPEYPSHPAEPHEQPPKILPDWINDCCVFACHNCNNISFFNTQAHLETFCNTTNESISMKTAIVDNCHAIDLKHIKADGTTALPPLYKGRAGTAHTPGITASVITTVNITALNTNNTIIAQASSAIIQNCTNFNPVNTAGNIESTAAVTGNVPGHSLAIAAAHNNIKADLPDLMAHASLLSSVQAIANHPESTYTAQEPINNCNYQI